MFEMPISTVSRDVTVSQYKSVASENAGNYTRTGAFVREISDLETVRLAEVVLNSVSEEVPKTFDYIG